MEYEFSAKDKYYSITIEKLLNIVHSYTDPIRIQVVMDGAFFKFPEAKHMRGFTLTKCYRDDISCQEEKERLLKYYKDVPVWNLTVWTDRGYSSPFGRASYCGIEARCYYADMRDGYLAEKADTKRAKARERYRKRKLKMEES